MLDFLGARGAGEIGDWTRLKLWMKISDSNDETPTFIGFPIDFKISLSENSNPNAVNPIASIKAVDKDTGINGRVSYTINSVTAVSRYGDNQIQCFGRNLNDVAQFNDNEQTKQGLIQCISIRNEAPFFSHQLVDSVKTRSCAESSSTMDFQ